MSGGEHLYVYYAWPPDTPGRPLGLGPGRSTWAHSDPIEAIGSMCLETADVPMRSGGDQVSATGRNRLTTPTRPALNNAAEILALPCA